MGTENSTIKNNSICLNRIILYRYICTVPTTVKLQDYYLYWNGYSLKYSNTNCIFSVIYSRIIHSYSFQRYHYFNDFYIAWHWHYDNSFDVRVWLLGSWNYLHRYIIKYLLKTYNAFCFNVLMVYTFFKTFI